MNESAKSANFWSETHVQVSGIRRGEAESKKANLLFKYNCQEKLRGKFFF